MIDQRTMTLTSAGTTLMNYIKVHKCAFVSCPSEVKYVLQKTQVHVCVVSHGQVTNNFDEAILAGITFHNSICTGLTIYRQ